MKRKFTISQCMIVKNEEKNIRKALSWGKSIVCEQIVVDTGSTDRTVEIAESMGAKVLSFQWIDDFSAAKNFAIEQAKGDWIAFLDADEYYNEKDAHELYRLIQKYSKQPEWKQKNIIIRSAWLQLDDSGNIFSTSVQDRVFKNTPRIRYKNKIHEILDNENGKHITYINAVDQLSIYHTGYSASAYAETGKAERNIRLLQKEVEDDPLNYNRWSYLGESLLAANRLDEAEQALQQALLSPVDEITPPRLSSAYINLMQIIVMKNPEDGEKQLQELKAGLTEKLTNYPDTDYWLGIWYHNHQKNKEAAVYLVSALDQLDQIDAAQTSSVSSNLKNIYLILIEIYFNSGEKQLCVKYCVFLLKLAPRTNSVLKILLTLFGSEPGNLEDATPVYLFLEKFYDFTVLLDKLFVMKAAKELGFLSLYDLLFQSMSKEEQKWLIEKPQDPCRLSFEACSERYPNTPCSNEADRDFLTLIERIRSMEKDEIVEYQKKQANDLAVKFPNVYNVFLPFFSRFPFWGSLDPENSKYEVFELRTETLKLHWQDFVWLYGRLGDNRSRRVLTTILLNWMNLDQTSFSQMEKIAESSPMYFDLDLISSGKDETFVDLGAYTGDTIQDYLNTYGETYKKIYCYEITPSSLKILKSKTKYYDNIEVRPLAAGSFSGTLYLDENQESSENRALSMGDTAVKVVTIDEDIQEPVTFIKVSLVGSEQEALKGCRRHITEEHPKLAICTYYGYEDIWKIPRMIDEMDGSYHFYLRYYGGNIIPTKFVFYAV